MPALLLRATQDWTKSDARPGADQSALAVASVGLLAVVFPDPAFGQVQAAGSFSLQSNQTFRGESISLDDPGASLAVAIDGPGGLFVGGDISVAAGTSDRLRITAHSQYAGVAVRKGRTSLEFGVIHRKYRENVDVDYRNDFIEGFVGVSRGNTKVRIYASPNYMRDGRTSYYAEADTKLLSVGKWSLQGHGGITVVPQDAGAPTGTMRFYEDWSLSLGREVRGFNLSFSLASSNYPVVSASGKVRLSAVISRAF